VEQTGSFFRGSELPRLLVLVVVAFCGWVLMWHRFQERPQVSEPAPTATERPEPLVADRSIEFESVTDRTPMSFRDNAAYSLLLARARGRTPAELAAQSRRDVLLAHLWQTPELYRGVAVHIEGTANRVIRYPAVQSAKGWLYEAWIYTQDAPKVPYVGVFEDAPPGFPLGASVSESVVFNGYFLKLMKYHAGDVPRGAPVLVGRIGWRPPAPDSPWVSGSTTRWMLVAVVVLFVISLFRWVLPMRRLFALPGRTRARSSLDRPREIDAQALNAWLADLQEDDEGMKDEG